MISARNQLKGTISRIASDNVVSQVFVDIGGGQEIVAVITTDSVRDMGLKQGDIVHAVIKSTSVMIGRE
ncbi:MAG: TOBE domain-containing protein [Candidatus Saccharibacteria bacterium]